MHALRVSACLLCAFAEVLGFTACGSGKATFSQNPPPLQSQEFLYGSDLAGVVVTEQVNLSSGALGSGTEISGSNGGSIATTPSGAFLYAPDLSTNMMDGFVNTSGTLALMSGSPFPAFGAGGIAATAVDSSGKYLYAISATTSGGTATGIVDAFMIDGMTGALSPVSGSPFAAGMSPIAMKADPAGAFLYVIDRSSGMLAFSISSNGGLTPIPMSTTPAGSQDLAITSNGAYLYSIGVANIVYGYSINSATGELTAIPGSPFQILAGTGNFSSRVVVDPSGTFLYTYNTFGSPTTIAGFRIDAGAGALTPIPGSPFTAAMSTFSAASLAVEPSGKYLYASCADGSCGILGFSMDGTTGALTPLTGSPFNSQFNIGSMAIVQMK